jgi:phosphopantothenoylcysteine synthetase/decarboxylase
LISLNTRDLARLAVLAASRKTWKGTSLAMNVVVTGGATIAPIDDVRFMTNVSSGRFAAEITEACLLEQARVWHVHAPRAELPLVRSSPFDLDTADPALELDRLLKLRDRWLAARDRLTLVPLEPATVKGYATSLEQILKSNPIDLAILPMAVADFEPEPQSGKISSDLQSLVVHCHGTPKVIRQVRDWAPSVFLVGFKLLSRVPLEELIARATASCLTNRADLTVANDLETLRAGRHTIHLVSPGSECETLGPGPDLARRLVARIFERAALARPKPRSALSSAGPNP